MTRRRVTASRWETLRARDVMTSRVRVLEPGLRLDQAIHVLGAEGVSDADARVHTTPPDAPLAEVAGEMARRRVHRLLVMEG